MPENYAKTKEELISKLLDVGFLKVAPHTLFYKDEVDVISVYLGDVIIVTADGENVATTFEIRQIFETEYFWEDVFQDILAKF